MPWQGCGLNQMGLACMLLFHGCALLGKMKSSLLFVDLEAERIEGFEGLPAKKDDGCELQNG